jgi:ABC-2 type transport system ATP-binding protein
MKMQRNTDPAGNSIGIEPTVRVEDVYKSFQDKKKSLFSWRFEAVTVPALRGVSLDVYAGEVFGLLGPNSSGKTTLLRCMSTLCKPDRGAVYVLGKHTVRESFAVRHCIGVVFQDAGVDKILTGREHMELFGNLYHMPPAHLRRRIDELVGMLELEPYVDRLTGTYSGGIKRRLDLALGLLHEPSVLLLDEPTVGLDLSSRRVIWNAVRKYATAGNTIVFTSHYLEEVEILADRVAILDEGVSIAVGSPPDLKRQIGGRRFTIRVEEFCPENIAQAALEALRSEGIVERAQINAFDYNALELFVEPELLDQLGIDPSLNEDEAYSVYAERIRQTLKGKGFDLFGITERGVSLSDVYMSFAGRDFRAADEAARLDASTKKRKPKRRSSLES